MKPVQNEKKDTTQQFVTVTNIQTKKLLLQNQLNGKTKKLQ